MGISPLYREAAVATGAALARRGIPLIYGGGRVGLMGVLADAVLEEGGEAIGVIPRGLVEREIEHRGLTSLHVVERSSGGLIHGRATHRYSRMIRRFGNEP
jgi:predicted Rossmann-fold nucleotide-binding protein